MAGFYNVYSVLSFRIYRHEGRIYRSCCTYAWRLACISCNQISSCYGLIRAGISTIISVIWFVFANDFLEYILNKDKAIAISNMNLSDWSTDISINGNVLFITLLSSCIIGVVLIGIGAFLMRKKNI